MERDEFTNAHHRNEYMDGTNRTLAAELLVNKVVKILYIEKVHPNSKVKDKITISLFACSCAPERRIK